jgi:hypothetical protein
MEVVLRPPPPEEAPEELGWKDWLLKRYAKVWFWIGCLFLDAMIFLETQRTLSANMLMAVMATVAVAVVQLFVYLRIWGRGGPLSENDKE